MTAVASRHRLIGSIKPIFDELIDRHAEAYIAAFSEVQEFSNFERAGVRKYYIGMVHVDDYKKPDTQQLKIRGSQSIAGNEFLELDLSSVTSEHCFFPGQIVAFQGEPHRRKQLTVRNFLDSSRISPMTKVLNMTEDIRLMVALGPYMKPDQLNWTLIDKLIEQAKSNNATHIILMGPFIEFDNKCHREEYDTSWRALTDRLIEGLHDLECHIYIVPSNKDIFPSQFATSYAYPYPQLDLKFSIKSGAKPKCVVNCVTDPANLYIDGLSVDVTSADVVSDMNNCCEFINRGPGSKFNFIYRHLITHGMYPIQPSSPEIAIDYTRLAENFMYPTRLGAHLMILPSKFGAMSAVNVDDRVVVTVQKCFLKKQVLMVNIPRVTSEDESKPTRSIVASGYTSKIIELQSSTESTQ